VIVVDTSALIAILLEERQARACKAVLETEDEVLISAGTLAEALVVAARRNVREAMAKLIDELDFQIVAVSAASARGIGRAYEKWGKGTHRAGLNFGDCFAYELAKNQGCRLLYVGDDFSKTDIKAAL
jgi:ribonuclease VapC